jgi:hypothetical protein
VKEDKERLGKWKKEMYGIDGIDGRYSVCKGRKSKG